MSNGKMKKQKLSALPVKCRFCKEEVRPNETFKHVQTKHGITAKHVDRYYECDKVMERLANDIETRLKRRNERM